MSGICTGWVLRHGPQDHAMKAVLVVIADAANADGEHAHPGIGFLVTASGYSRATVFRALDRLAAEGWIEVEETGGGRGRATVYRVLMETPKRSHPETVSEPKRSHPETTTVSKGSHPGSETVSSSDFSPYTATGSYNGNGGPRVATSDPQTSSRLPSDFAVTDAMRAWVEEHLPGLDWREQTERFCDYWTAQSGASARKDNWQAAWRYWMRKARDYAPRRTNGKTSAAIASLEHYLANHPEEAR